MREALVSASQARGIPLRQSYVKVAKKALIMQGRYSTARQSKRAAKQTRKLKTFLGRVVRDIERKAVDKDEALSELLARANRLLVQQRQDKNKLYSVHAPEVECIAKDKVHKRYEFGNKASFVTGNWVVGAQSLQGSPYDGHTLGSASEQVKTLSGKAAKVAYCDQGYRGHGLKGETDIKIVGKIPKRATRAQRKWLKRRTAIEPIIGHLKSDHRLTRSHLKGINGNQANVILAAAAYNLAKLLAWFYCAWINSATKKKPPIPKGHNNGGSRNNTEHPDQVIFLIMRCWVNNRKVVPLKHHPFG